jgi:hypothetical protein
MVIRSIAQLRVGALCIGYTAMKMKHPSVQYYVPLSNVYYLFMGMGQ